MGKGQLLFFLPAILHAIHPGGNEELAYDEIHTGNATYYLEADGAGNCLFDELPEPQYVGALNNYDYNSPVIAGTSYQNATLCGAYARVSGSRGSIIIKIVDRCPDAICEPGHIDLSLEAFSAIDEPARGFVPITWQLVAAPVSGPVRFRYKDGSSQWWTAIQVRNHRNPVASLEVKVGEGWKPLPRRQYNYFIAEDGLGKGYHTFRVTDIFDNQLIETSTIFLDGFSASEIDWHGQGQFP